MKPSILSFLDEMQFIASPGLRKESGVMRNVGEWSLKQARGIGKDIHGAAKAFGSPTKGVSEGAKFIHNDFKSANPFWKAMTAYGLVSGAPEALAKEDPSGQGRSRLNRMTRFAGAQAGNVIGAPYGFVGGTLASLAGEGAGAMIGKGIDKARGIKLKRPLHPEPSINPTPLKIVAPQI